MSKDTGEQTRRLLRQREFEVKPSIPPTPSPSSVQNVGDIVIPVVPPSDFSADFSNDFGA